MPLLDHFHAPIYPARSWESFHSRWANSIADSLNELLPRRYVAEVQIHLGSRVEADVAEFERPLGPEDDSGNGAAGGLAIQAWARALYAVAYRPARRHAVNEIDI